MKAIKWVAVALGALVLLAGITAGVLYGLAVTDDNAGKYETEPSAEVASPLLKAAFTGQETEISQDQLNGFLAYVIQEAEITIAEHPVKKIYLQLGDAPGEMALYLVAEALGRDLGVTARGTLTYSPEENQLSLTFEEMKIGRLKMPADWVLSWISPKLSDEMAAEGKTLLLDSSLFEMQMATLSTPLTLENLRVENGSIYITVSGAMEALEEYLKNQLGSGLGELISGFGGNFS